ncbi:hypothetical protein TNCV_1690651 [Trichonephila clavipes]|nr:hypothetical protein TNCV_1690651 [Trichonephila clavipes]
MLPLSMNSNEVRSSVNEDAHEMNSINCLLHTSMKKLFKVCVCSISPVCVMCFSNQPCEQSRDTCSDIPWTAISAPKTAAFPLEIRLSGDYLLLAAREMVTEPIRVRRFATREDIANAVCQQVTGFTHDCANAEADDIQCLPHRWQRVVTAAGATFRVFKPSLSCKL